MQSCQKTAQIGLIHLSLTIYELKIVVVYVIIILVAVVGVRSAVGAWIEMSTQYNTKT